MKRGADGSIVAAPIWNNFMRAALEGSPVESFPSAPPNDATKPVLRGVGAPGHKIKVDRVSGKLATEWTPKETTEELVYVLPHTILYYLNKDDPRGPTPTNPGQDPHFAPWEAAVRSWIERRRAKAEENGTSLSFDDPPTESDDVHTPESRPTVTIRQPDQNASITSNRLAVRVDASGKHQIREVRLAVDGQLVGTMQNTPWETAVFLPLSLAKGFHDLHVTAVDAVENYVTASVAFSYEPKTLLDLELVKPQPGETFASSDGVPVTLLTANPQAITAITFYVQSENADATVIASVSQPEQAFTTFVWRGPAVGTYRLWAEITRTDSATLRTGAVTITVR